ncbi:MAG: gliding motility-associated C-terminal domain-containing protein, partial [Chryseosolibacter sp.]
DGAGPCVAVSDNVVITINALPTVNAGADQTICGNATVTLNGARGGSASSASWSGGTGSFAPDANTLNAVYTPSAAEVAAGTVTLTLTTNDPDGAGPCVAVSDDLTITINALATVDAGPDQTVCAGGTVNLAGVTGGSASSATWSGGTGAFSPNANDVNAAYTPSAAEITAGTVTLTLTTNDPDGAGPCVAVSDNITITINEQATVDAGPAQSVCAGATVTLAGAVGGSASTGTWSGGTGTFTPDNLALNATYTPGAADIALGSVTLTLTTDDPDGAGPCVAVSDNVTITINALGTADAGPDQTICPGATATLNGVIGGSAVTGTWSGGAGTFAPNNTALNATYTPTAAEVAAGTITLTLTATGGCNPVSDNVVIAVDQPATANAGGDQAICAGGTVSLAGSVGGSALSGTWSGGTGTFTPDNTALNATYTPSAAEVAAGTVTLTLTTSGPCAAASDNVVITIQGPATANAGTDQQICEGNTATLAGAIGGSAVSATWSGGAGTFSPDNTALNAVYTPTAGEITAGTVTLTLTTTGPCAAVTDDITITINPMATVNAGADQIICSSGSPPLAGSGVGGSATTAAWTIVNQPTGGDGSLSNLAQTATPASVSFSATVAGTYTLRLTSNDPAGVCTAATDDVVIAVTAAATANAGGDQTICAGGTATLGGSFTGTTGISWSTSGTGTFNDASLTNAVYTPSAADISAGTVTLTLATAGPCASVNDAMVITINAAPTVDAGAPQTVCSSGSIVLSATFGGSATGLSWTSSGNGTFNDNTDPDATYLPGSTDIAAGTVTLTATATGSCPGISDNVVITLNPAAIVDAGAAQTICVGGTVQLDATLTGSAATMTWTTSGDGTFDSNTNPDAIYTPGTNDITNGTATLTSTTNNPAGPCPATADNVVITFMTIPGDQTTAGNETWIGYVYDDTGSPGLPPANINFNNAKYRGFIASTDIDNMSGASTYDVGTDEFDMNLGLAIPVQGPNVCGNHLNYFSVRYKMNKTLPAGIYRFTVGGDDGVRLLVDGVDVLPPAAFGLHSYTPYTSGPVCLTAGVHAFEIQYFDNTAQSRLTFNYETVPDLTTTSPVNLCVNSAAPTLAASSTDADVVDFNWYKNGALVFTGASFTPSAADLDMTAAGSATFAVTSVYACGETAPTDVVVNVVNSAALVINPETVCESGGVVDLRTLVSESPAGGTFAFSGHPNISGNNFDPSGLAGSVISILVDYSVGTCTAPQGTLALTISNTATVNVPATAVPACESAPDIDLTALVSASPSGGTFTFSGTQVAGNLFNPSGLSGMQTITVNYSVGGCNATATAFDIDVTTTASIATTNVNACETGSSVNLLTLAAGVPAGGTFIFTGVGVSGSMFDPSGLSGTVNITVDYDFNGCTANGIIQVTVLAPGDPLCTGGNCADVVIIPLPEPATCTNSDGRLVMSINPFTPAVNNTGVKITIDGISSTGLPITRTIFNDDTFEALPVGSYTYSIEYGDPSCVKTGLFSIDQSGTVGTPVVSNIISPVCAGSATGSLTLDVPGETGNILEWSLDGGLTDPFKPFTAGTQITGIPAGPAPSFQQVISVRRNVADVCYSSVTVVMPEGVPPISATFVVTPATCNGNDGAVANIVPGGGNGAPYIFSIDGGQSFQSAASFNGLPGGSYTLRVRDAAGCENDFSANVTFPGFINSAITKNNADCTNNGISGSISVSVNDPGVFEVAVTTDQFNAPDASEYQPYNNPSVTFSSLARGQYYVYVKSNGAACPTRSAPINIFGVYAINFDIQPDCNNNELSIALVNVTGESGGAPLEIQVSKKLSSDPPEIIYQQFPVDGEVYLAYDQHAFLKTPGEYRIRIIQFQNEVICNLSSQTIDFAVPSPLNAQIGSVSTSYPDIPSGKLMVSGFSGGIYPYEVKIELDSASSFALPEYETNFEEAGLNQNQQVEKAYARVPAGRYQVQVMDSLGCVVTLIARVPLDESLFIPNVFTPNGDGSNDVFFIRNLPPAPSVNQLIVSNRWGKEVFASENYQNNWDGEGATDGLYFYRLQVTDGEALTGWIEIMRGQKP